MIFSISSVILLCVLIPIRSHCVKYNFFYMNFKYLTKYSSEKILSKTIHLGIKCSLQHVLPLNFVYQTGGFKSNVAIEWLVKFMVLTVLHINERWFFKISNADETVSTLTCCILVTDWIISVPFSILVSCLPTSNQMNILCFRVILH